MILIYHVCLGSYTHFYRYQCIIFNFHYFLYIRQRIPSLSLFCIKCSNRGLLLIICLILNLSLKGIITEPGKLTTLPFSVTVIFCQSISIISHIVFLCKVIFSLFILPVNLNKWILPEVLHNLMGT